MKQKIIFWVLTISLLGAGLYFHTYDYDYTGDDGIYAYFNRVTQKGLSEWTELFKYGSMNFITINPVNTSIYRPFTLLTFAMEYQVFGEFNASNGHVINVILYFFLLIVIGKLLVDLCAKKELPVFVPLLILALYAVHPLHTEVVASVKSRDTLMASLFAFSAILVWVKSENKLTLGKQILIGFLFFLSLLSKEETITLLAIVAFIAYFFQKKKVIDSLKEVIPFFIPVVIYMICRAFVLDSVGTVYDSKINSILYGLSGGERLATNLYIYLQYLKLLVFPHPLSWDYSFSHFDVQSFRSPLVWASLILFAALFYVAYKGFKSRSLFSFGILFYLATFSIFANLTQSLTIGSNLGERFLFIPSLAFSFLLVYGLYRLLLKFQIKQQAMVAILVLMPVLLAFSWKTVDRAKVWKDAIALSSSGVKTAPTSWRTHVMYAEELRLKGAEIKKTSRDSAKSYFEEAVRQYDRVYQILGKDAPVSQYLAPLAESLLGVGDTARAKVVLNESLKKLPNNYFSKFKLAAISYEEGDYEKAKSLYLESLNAEKPDLHPAYKNLGLTYMRLDDYTNAIKYFELALAEKDEPELKRNLAYLYTEEGDFEKAASYQSEGDEYSVEETSFLFKMREANDAFSNGKFNEASSKYMEIESDFEEFGGSEKFPSFYAAFGKSLIESKDTVAAKSKFLKAYQVDPKNAVVLTNLGTISFMKEQNFQNAEKYFKEATDANPENPFSAHTNLGTVYIVLGKEEQAVEEFEKALQYGTSRPVLSNLYLLNKVLGNEEQMNYYQEQLNNFQNQ